MMYADTGTDQKIRKSVGRIKFSTSAYAEVNRCAVFYFRLQERVLETTQKLCLEVYEKLSAVKTTMAVCRLQIVCWMGTVVSF